MDERQGEVQAALHPAGVRADAAVGRQRETDALEQLVAALPTLVPRDPVQCGLEAHVVAPGEERVEEASWRAAPIARRTSGPFFTTSKPATVAFPALGGRSVVVICGRSSTCPPVRAEE
jgi:hypothetical protein